MRTVPEGYERTTKSEVERRTMRGLRPLGRGETLLVTFVCLGLGLMAGLTVGIDRSDGGLSTGAPVAKDFVYLTIAFNPVTGLDEYFPANFTVPAGVPVVFTITNYDNGTNSVPNAIGAVQGTIDGTETVSVAGQPSETLRALPGSEVVHTFTIHSGGVSLNVPIPSAASQSSPTVVTFTALFSAVGAYTWQCMAPCDPSAMATPGFMMGTMTVVSG